MRGAVRCLVYQRDIEWQCHELPRWQACLPEDDEPEMSIEQPERACDVPGSPSTTSYEDRSGQSGEARERATVVKTHGSSRSGDRGGGWPGRSAASRQGRQIVEAEESREVRRQWVGGPPLALRSVSDYARSYNSCGVASLVEDFQ